MCPLLSTSLELWWSLTLTLFFITSRLILLVDLIDSLIVYLINIWITDIRPTATVRQSASSA